MVGHSMAWYWRDMAIIPDTGRVNVFLDQRGASCASWMRHICFPINVACQKHSPLSEPLLLLAPENATIRLVGDFC